MTSPANRDENPYRALRDTALHTPASTLGPYLAVDDSGVYGVVMDWGLEKGVATLTTYLSGDASLYFSSGGGVIGGFAHPEVRSAAMTLANAAKSYLPYFAEAQEFTLPRTGTISFYMLRTDRIGFASASQTQLVAGTHDLSPLWQAAQGVVHELRLVADKPAQTPAIAGPTTGPAKVAREPKPWWRFW